MNWQKIQKLVHFVDGEPHKLLEDSKQVLANVLSDKSCYAVEDMRTGHIQCR